MKNDLKAYSLILEAMTSWRSQSNVWSWPFKSCLPCLRTALWRLSFATSCLCEVKIHDLHVTLVFCRSFLKTQIFQVLPSSYSSFLLFPLIKGTVTIKKIVYILTFSISLIQLYDITSFPIRELITWVAKL